MVKHIGTDAAFALPGFSPAVAVSSELILVSGQVAIGLDGQIVGKGDFDAQVKQTMQNLGAVLAAAGASFKDVVRVGVILSDRKYLSQWRELGSRYFFRALPGIHVDYCRSGLRGFAGRSRGYRLLTNWCAVAN
jgi:2-iminobutanoate/2-iminopropanoate deaminase